MSERDDIGGKSGRQPAEGVRIIRPEEAQAALEAGEAAGRRPDDQLRFGDVPPAPSGPRPAHRFPLPDSVNPADAVALPPLATPRRPAEGPARRPPPAEAGSDWRVVQGDPEPYGGEARYDDEPRYEEEPYRGYEPEPYRPEPPEEEGYEPDAGRFASDDITRAMAPPPPPPEPPRYRNRPDDRPEQAPERTEDRYDAGPGRYPAPSWTPEPAPEPTPLQKEPPISMNPSWGSEPTSMFEEADDRTTEMSVPDEGLTVSAGAPEMPHWTDPPTGEVPRLRFDDDDQDEEDLEAWKAVGSRGVRWRHEDDWNDVDELSDLVGEGEEPIGALDSSRTEHSDLYSFDEDFERLTRTGSTPAVDLTGDEADFADDFEPPPPRRERPAARTSRTSRTEGRSRTRSRSPLPEIDDGEEEVNLARVGEHRTARSSGSRAGRRPAPAPRPSRPSRPADDRSSGGRDLTSRVAIGAGLIALLIVAYAVGAKALVALSLVVVVAAAAEAYKMVRTAGFRPATLLGLVAAAGCVLAAYWKGPGAIATVSVFLMVGAMLWYVLGVVEARPLANVAVTVMVFVWVAVLGSFAAVMLAQPSGQGEFLGAIVVAVAADVCAYGVGRWIGSRPLAPRISPHKTVEGFVGGLVGALIAGAIIGKELTPWSGMRHGLVLGLLVGLIAPVGDLFESLIKRDLGIKDSGTVLAGHGGLLDRFDGILVALPTAYFVITFFKL